MKYSLSTLSAIAVFACISCSNPTTENPKPIAGQVYGDTIMKGAFLPLADLKTELQSNESITTKITGRVTEVCAKKGCWIKVAMPNGGQLFVDFKDYAFFVPKDIKGSTVALEGKAYYSNTSVEQLKHYAKDAGKSDAEIAAITQPKNELHFTATGVHVTP